MNQSDNPRQETSRATPRLYLPEVDPRDIPALSDLVRFGLMADDQIARRYADTTFALTRLPELKAAGIIDHCWEILEGANVYVPTRLARLVAGVPSTRPRAIHRPHISHDVAVVDLADYLVSLDTTWRWVTESEVRDFLDNIAPSPRHVRGDTRHRPDGLLLVGDERIGIELEHTDKYQTRYRDISGWFVREWRVDRVRWFVDNPRIAARLRQINADHGFDHDMQIEIEPFPPGVRLRQPPRKYRPRTSNCHP